MPNDRSIRLFGRVSARAGNTEISDFATAHARTLLVFLAMHPDVDHPRDRLVQALWPGRIDGSSRNRLSVTLYHARRGLVEADPEYEEAFVTGRSTIRLDSSFVDIDLHHFRRHVARARTAELTSDKREHYQHAFDSYKGPLAPDLAASWTVARQVEASQMFEETALWLAHDLDKQGNRDLAQDLLARALDTEPYSECAAVLLTSWYMGCDRHDLAVACAKRLRRALAVHGLAPSPPMLERIEQMNAHMLERPRPVFFVDEAVITVLAVRGSEREAFENIVREHGGTYNVESGYGLFTNPLMAMEAGSKVLARTPKARGLVHSTVMGPNDPVPHTVPDGLATLERRGLYGSESFAALVRERDQDTVRKVGNKVWAVT